MNNGEPTSNKHSQSGTPEISSEDTSLEDTSLDDVFQEFLLAVDTPDASTLEAMVAKYPEHAADLTEFAVEWAMQDMLPPGEDFVDDAAEAPVSSAVAKAMDRLHEGLDAQAEQADPFRKRSAADLKNLAAALGLDKTLVAKLRDRRIEASSIPRRLTAALAEQLEVTFDAVRRHLEGPPVLSVGASFKAKGKPEAAGKESFAQAVERAQLTDDDKQRLLDLSSDDG